MRLSKTILVVSVLMPLAAAAVLAGRTCWAAGGQEPQRSPVTGPSTTAPALEEGLAGTDRPAPSGAGKLSEEGKRLQAGPETRALSGRGRSPWTDLANTLGALAVVAVMILAARFAIKRAAGTATRDGPASFLTVLARKPVGPKQQLLLVRFGRRVLLVGAGPKGMATLSQADDPAEVLELLGTAGGSDGQPGAPHRGVSGDSLRAGTAGREPPSQQARTEDRSARERG